MTETAERKNTTKEEKDKASKGKGAKDWKEDKMPNTDVKQRK